MSINTSERTDTTGLEGQLLQAYADLAATSHSVDTTGHDTPTPQVETGEALPQVPTDEYAEARSKLVGLLLSMQGYQVTATCAPVRGRSPIELYRYADGIGWMTSRDKRLRTASGTLSESSVASVESGILYLEPPERRRRGVSLLAVDVLSRAVSLNIMPID